MTRAHYDQAHPCPCGSGRSSWWAHDARGIELARVCTACIKQKLSGYRSEVLTDPNYETTEDIDDD